MKYTNQVIIDLPRNTVVSLFQNPENYSKWQEGLQAYIPLHGTPGQKGAQASLKFDMGKRKIEMTETILENQLPDQITVSYATQGVYNLQISLFEAINVNKTMYTTHNEFNFSGFMKIIGWLMPGAFKKQSQKYLENFKQFAEKAEGIQQITAV